MQLPSFLPESSILSVLIQASLIPVLCGKKPSYKSFEFTQCAYKNAQEYSGL